jgi:hypothetical protein
MLIFIAGVPLCLLRAQQREPGPNEFDVDGDCRIYEMVLTAKGPKQHTYKDKGICSVDGGHETSITETDVSGGERRHITTKIREHTFTLHNPTSEPATFVVEQAVTPGWEIDSDPKPNEMVGTIARFFVTAKPRETVSLHVGERNQPRL